MLERLETLSKITIKQALNVYGALPLSVFERVGERGKKTYKYNKFRSMGLWS